MLFTTEVLRKIVDGKVDLAFRRWKRPGVRAGTKQRTAVGVLEVTSLQEVAIEDITPREAPRAGAGSLAGLRRELQMRSGTTYRIGIRYAGKDPRAALRERAIANDEELEEVLARLRRYDSASSWGPWTMRVLRAIEASPGTRAAELAAGFERETSLFKADVRKLKELGLTESLRVGYRLSRRGESLLAHDRERGE